MPTTSQPVAHCSGQHDLQQSAKKRVRRSLLDKFLQEEQERNTLSKDAIRVNIARAKNRKDREHNNMRKTKERIRKLNEQFRTHEAAYIAAKDDIAKLELMLRDEETDSDY
jgi:DNA repair ATPase RecN